MTALFITQHYHPEPNFITAELAQRLSVVEDQVCVVTAHPNYPLGRFYDSVDSVWPKCEKTKNLSVWRLPIYPSHNHSKLARLIHYMSFAVAATFVAPLVCWRPKTVIVYQTPFTTALAALWFKYVFGAKLVYICADLWPESFAASGIRLPKWLEDLMYWYSRWINRRADLVICTTKGMRKRYEQDGIAPARLVYMPLWVDASGGVLPEQQTNEKSDQILSCAYIGNLGAAQGVETIVRAAGILQKRQAPLRFDIFGSGVEDEKLRTIAAELGLKNLIFHGRISPDEAFQKASSCGVQLIHLVPSPLFAMTVPSKLAFSLSAGTPIAAGLIGESAAIVEESGGGMVVEPNNSEALAQVLLRYVEMGPKARQDYGKRARQYYDAHFAKPKLAARYVEVIRGVTQKMPPSSL